MASIFATVVVVAALSSGSINARTSQPPEQGTGAPAQAASPQADAKEIRRRVKEGQKVRITDDQGREWRGRIATLAPDTLSLVMPDRRQMDIGYGNILRIDRPHDSLANGALIGLASGAALGLLAVISEENAECDAGTFFSCGDPSAAEYVVVPAILGGLGAAIGVGIDALISREPNLYLRAGKARVVFSPALGRGLHGFTVTLRW
ncbi:MAG: hypothetical protein H0X67_04735 [Acidobacteria bacterium]|nr:hypothetical protein [Acidobacteriota bacterium]